MNHDVPSPPAPRARLSPVMVRVLDLLLDEIPDRTYRVAVETHGAIVRTRAAVLTRGRRLVARLRATVLP